MQEIPRSTMLDQPMAEETAQAVMLALRAGRTLGGICSKRRGNADWITYRSRFSLYCTLHPEYAAVAAPQIEKSAAAAQKRKGDRWRNITRCKYGHPYSGSKVQYLPSGYRKYLAC
jgi:hypothetical protein